MSNLTDLEICKCIAEIESVKVRENKGGLYLNEPVSSAHNVHTVGAIYNPLTDGALWQQLILKHEVSISFVTCTLLMIRGGVYENNFTDIPSLKRKALLLIIEAHKDNNNE